jgi:GNAT superfamily N-acetyltransferase
VVTSSSTQPVLLSSLKGMWVEPSLRGKGVAKVLLAGWLAVCAAASGEVTCGGTAIVREAVNGKAVAQDEKEDDGTARKAPELALASSGALTRRVFPAASAMNKPLVARLLQRSFGFTPRPGGVQVSGTHPNPLK